jgi:hypothetical protein
VSWCELPQAPLPVAHHPSLGRFQLRKESTVQSKVFGSSGASVRTRREGNLPVPPNLASCQKSGSTVSDPCPATRNQATLRLIPKTHSCMSLSPPIHYAFWLVNQDLTSSNLQVANSTREKFAVDLAPDLRAGDLSSAFFLVLLKKLRFFWRRGSISGGGGRRQSASADPLPRLPVRVARGVGRSALRLDKG